MIVLIANSVNLWHGMVLAKHRYSKSVAISIVYGVLAKEPLKLGKTASPLSSSNVWNIKQPSYTILVNILSSRNL